MNLDIETEHINIGTFIERNGLYLGIENIGKRVWTNDLNIATLYNTNMTMDNAISFMVKLKLEIDNITLITVKKVTQYQLGEF